MEDDDLQDGQLETKSVTKERPYRLTNIVRHDCTKAFANNVLELALDVLDNLPSEHMYKDVATALKRKLDETEKGTWHVIAGSHFGANVTNDAETLVNMKIDDMYVLVFRSGPPDRPLTNGEAE
ncbi:putative Dynein light chain type 1 [Trypanosoma vivax]|uniref:Dynein light chain n=1 Tax=Trypanosoma vivax (strain Y486) TaxID=1055687 RepID=G0U6W3_TRYVY|nr:putative dynein light chain [Trypanosoma vivax]KAH8611958.1 putative Dynein light chain type 1 [Trypanosoma vivax]CCC51619.1 putative dynein light chain [Trypanosoma vivax Y486]